MDDDVIGSYLARARERESAVVGFELQNEVEEAQESQEHEARATDELLAAVEKHPEAGIMVLMGLKAHLDLERALEEEHTGIYYLTKDSDPEDIALAKELELEDDGIDDGDEPDEGDFED